MTGSRFLVSWCLLVSMALPSSATALPRMVFSPLRSSLLAASSIHTKLLACLARGDIAGAVVMYEAQTGQAPPAWLLELQGAYAVTQQIAGKCQQVARVIHTAFTRLGQAPRYIAFRAKGDEEFMVFELTSGRSAPVSRNSYHVAVELGDHIYDAYTGPTGMKLTEYLGRLHARQGITWDQVVAP